MTSNNPGRIRRRVTIGGILAAAVALGVWLSQYLGGLGVGFGSGGTGVGKTSNDDPSKSKTVVTPKKVTSRVVEVRVDKQRYLLKQIDGGKVTFQPAELKKIVDLAKQSPGDDQGVKIRIYRRVGSIEEVITKLIAELVQAGLKRGEIDQLNDDFR